MASATISKKNSGVALAALEAAVADLESATAVLASSITRERGAPFGAVQGVWEAQQCLSDACKAAPVTGGGDLWPRVRAAKRTAEAALARSRRFYELWKKREAARRAHQGPRANGRVSVSSADTPAPTASGRWEFGDGDDFPVTLVDGGAVHTGVEIAA